MVNPSGSTIVEYQTSALEHILMGGWLAPLSLLQLLLRALHSTTGPVSARYSRLLFSSPETTPQRIVSVVGDSIERGQDGTENRVDVVLAVDRLLDEVDEERG